ncbi:MAG: M28 family peptidase [bacterium]|nr:M28 family peptidase [bacterium]
MSKRPLLLSTLLLFVPVAAGSQDPAPEDPLPEGQTAITAKEIEHHVRFLASDEMQGRLVATEHSRRAARYLARALKRAQLEPAGDDGTFLQAVPFYRTEHEAVPELRVWAGEGDPLPLTYGVDFTARVRGAPVSTSELEVLSVRSVEDLPATADPKVALLFHARAGDAKRWLEERGAPRGKGWGLVLRLGRTKAGKPGSLPRGGFGVVKGELTDDPEEVSVHGEWRTKFDDGQATRVQLVFHGERRIIDDYNVVGCIRGVGTPERPELAKEVIVLSAHYDHLGTRPGRDGGPPIVFNGADDDASGVAAVLEFAEAFAAGPKPARTLVFLLATGEERRILGTYHYVDHPFFPLEETVCNLNFEMLGRPDEVVGGAGKLWLTGYERSTLGPAFAERGIDVVADGRPDQNFFMRSDNIVFVRKGIVGQTLSTYNMHGDYHQPSDDWDALDYEHMEACARAGFAAAQLLADGSVSPEWNEGEPRLGRR